jgi:hypothetical protein
MTYKDLLSYLQQLSPEELNIQTKIFVPQCASENGEEYDDAFYDLMLITKYDEDAKMTYPYFHIIPEK